MSSKQKLGEERVEGQKEPMELHIDVGNHMKHSENYKGLQNGWSKIYFGEKDGLGGEEGVGSQDF